MNTINTGERQAQDVLDSIPASFREAFRVKLEYLEGAGVWSLSVGECSVSFVHLEKVQVQVEADAVRIKSGTTTLILYGGSYKFHAITIL